MQPTNLFPGIDPSSQSSRIERIIAKVTPWIAPERPGRGKRAGLAFAWGFLLGAIGIAIYLRSLADGLLLLCLLMLLYALLGDACFPVLWLVAGLWGVVRVKLDSREPIGASDAPPPPPDSDPQHQTSPPAV